MDKNEKPLSVRMKHWSTDKLMEEFRSCYEAIHEGAGYGMYEMVVVAVAPQLLRKRNYEVIIKQTYHITFNYVDNSGKTVYS